MVNDPNMLEWVAAIAPAVAILFTIPALRLAARNANAAERAAAIAGAALRAGTRPMLVDVPRRKLMDGPEEIMLAGVPFDVECSGQIVTSLDVPRSVHPFLSLPLRNAGTGVAVIEDIEIDVPGAGEIADSAAADRQHLQADGEMRVFVAVGRTSSAFRAFDEAINHGEAMMVRLRYTDLAVTRRYETTFEIRAIGVGPWRVTESWTTQSDPSVPDTTSTETESLAQRVKRGSRSTSTDGPRRSARRGRPRRK